MEIRVAICERDEEQRENAVETIKALPHDISCTEFNNAYDLMEVLEKNENAFDIICIATTLIRPGDGVHLAKQVRELSMQTTIIFLAENEKYYREAFQVFAMNYLMKPVRYVDMANCFAFYTKNRKVENRACWMLKSRGGNWLRVFCRDILYIESENREIRVHMTDGKIIESYTKLGEVKEQLPAEYFARCHQSYIVNLYYVSKLEGTSFEISGTTVPISRRYLKDVREQYYDYISHRSR